MKKYFEKYQDLLFTVLLAFSIFTVVSGIVEGIGMFDVLANPISTNGLSYMFLDEMKTNMIISLIVCGVSIAVLVVSFMLGKKASVVKIVLFAVVIAVAIVFSIIVSNMGAFTFSNTVYNRYLTAGDHTNALMLISIQREMFVPLMILSVFGLIKAIFSMIKKEEAIE